MPPVFALDQIPPYIGCHSLRIHDSMWQADWGPPGCIEVEHATTSLQLDGVSSARLYGTCATDVLLYWGQRTSHPAPQLRQPGWSQWQPGWIPALGKATEAGRALVRDQPLDVALWAGAASGLARSQWQKLNRGVGVVWQNIARLGGHFRRSSGDEAWHSGGAGDKNAVEAELGMKRR